jgi:superfamily II DNA/RNA helicase
MKTYADIDFVVSHGKVASTSQIKKTWVYVDSIAAGAEIIDHLRSLLPEHMHGAIRPYNAVHSHEYRKLAMRGFRDGCVRILVCTDAAGMVCLFFLFARCALNNFFQGCNVPDIDFVVQWKLPAKLSSFVQRAGRAARGPGRTGVAVLLAEPSSLKYAPAKGGATKARPKVRVCMTYRIPTCKR